MELMFLEENLRGIIGNVKIRNKIMRGREKEE